MNRGRLTPVRVIAVVALLGIAVAVSACGSSSSSSTSSGGGSTEASGGGGGNASVAAAEEVISAAEVVAVKEWPKGMPTEPVKVEPGKLLVAIPCSASVPGCDVSAQAAIEAAKAVGWSGKLISGELTTSGERAAIQQAIALHADAITMTGIDPRTLKGDIADARSHGAVISSMYSVPPSPESETQANVPYPAEELGKVVASKVIAEAGGKAKVALFWPPGFPALEPQKEEVENVLGECSECSIVANESFNPASSETELPTLTSSVIQKNPELNAIIVATDDWSQAVVPTASQLGSGVKVYSSNGEPAVLKLIAQGDTMAATAAYPLGWGGWEAVDQLARAMAGQKVVNGPLPVHLISKGNVPPNFEEWDGGGFDYKAKYKELWGVK